jgi:hypothetical protein
MTARRRQLISGEAECGQVDRVQRRRRDDSGHIVRPAVDEHIINVAVAIVDVIAIVIVVIRADDVTVRRQVTIAASGGIALTTFHASLSAIVEFASQT